MSAIGDADRTVEKDVSMRQDGDTPPSECGAPLNDMSGSATGPDVSVMQAWKTQAKSKFIKVWRRVLVDIMNCEDTEGVVEEFKLLEERYGRAVGVMAELMSAVDVTKDAANQKKVLTEIETMGGGDSAQLGTS